MPSSQAPEEHQAMAAEPSSSDNNAKPDGGARAHRMWGYARWAQPRYGGERARTPRAARAAHEEWARRRARPARRRRAGGPPPAGVALSLVESRSVGEGQRYISR